jgi:gamma-glutamyl hercynylcysteine S-oxide synthase
VSSAERKDQLAQSLESVRAKTLWLLDQVPDEFLRRRVHSFYSPIGWHFGHVGRTEEFWVVGEALKQPLLDDELSFLFADLPENPKDNRVNIPGREGIKEYLHATRERALKALDSADLSSEDPFLSDGYAWEFAIQHECQHQETIAEMLTLIHKSMLEDDPSARPDGERPMWRAGVDTRFIEIAGGTFCMGSDDLHGYDNEKCAHQQRVDPFLLAETPVTARQWSEFIEDGGYDQRRLWSDAGWDWKQREGATMPEYWRLIDGEFAIVGPTGLRWIHPDEPAGSLSWFEAEAFCRWTSARMPTEKEWEYAAAFDPATTRSRRYPWGLAAPTHEHACNGFSGWCASPVAEHLRGTSALGIQDMAGGLWEWTSTPFLPYPGFQAFPYDGYSKDHMKGEHRVCRGGSWATAGPILRCSFRNWYVPTYRQGFLGLRLAR